MPGGLRAGDVVRRDPARFTHHSEIVGTLPYLAPEQTGRTGRTVDQRADLYALGATLYELATGEPPFGSGDPLVLTTIISRAHRWRRPSGTRRFRARCRRSSCICSRRSRTRATSQRRACYTTSSACARRSRLRSASASAMSRRGCCRLRGWWAVSRKWRARGGVRAGADGPLPWRARRRRARDRQDGARQRAAGGRDGPARAGSWRASSTSTGETWSTTASFRRSTRCTGCCSPSPRTSSRRCASAPCGALGPNAGLATAVSPEAAALLRVPPDPGDPLTAQVRAQRSSVDFLRAVASRERPVVFFVDDLQWAGRTPLGLFELVLERGTHRGPAAGRRLPRGRIDPAHPLVELLARSREVEQRGAPAARATCRRRAIAALVAETLRVDSAAAGSLAEALEPYTSGNPYETVEVLNALRRDGLLTAAPTGWQWDAAAIRDHVGGAEVAPDRARVEAMPRASTELLEAMACLGGRAELRVLRTATGEPAAVVGQPARPGARRRPAGRGARAATLPCGSAMTASARRILDRPGTAAPARAAAGDGQAARATCPSSSRSLPSSTCPWSMPSTIPASAGGSRGCCRRAADQARDDRRQPARERAAVGSAAAVDADADGHLIEVHTARHAALYGLARLDEADEEYRVDRALAATSVAAR